MKKLSLVAIRHANAAPTDDGIDENRVLSEKGERQALARFASVQQHLNGTRVACVSTAKRAVQTAQLALPEALPKVRVPRLYLPPVGSWVREACDAQFERLKYSPLRRYLEDDTTGWTVAYGLEAVHALRNAMKKHKTSNIAVVGHAVCLNLIGAMLSPMHAEKLLDLELGEAEGFVIHGQDFHVLAES